MDLNLLVWLLLLFWRYSNNKDITIDLAEKNNSTISLIAHKILFRSKKHNWQGLNANRRILQVLYFVFLLY